MSYNVRDAQLFSLIYISYFTIIIKLTPHGYRRISIMCQMADNFYVDVSWIDAYCNWPEGQVGLKTLLDCNHKTLGTDIFNCI